MDRKQFETIITKQKMSFRTRFMIVAVVFIVFSLVDSAATAIFTNNFIVTLLVTLPVSLFILFTIGAAWISHKFSSALAEMQPKTTAKSRKKSTTINGRAVVKSTTKNVNSKKRRSRK